MARCFLMGELVCWKKLVGGPICEWYVRILGRLHCNVLRRATLVATPMTWCKTCQKSLRSIAKSSEVKLACWKAAHVDENYPAFKIPRSILPGASFFPNDEHGKGSFPSMQRKWGSKVCMCSWWMVRRPLAKHATDETTASKERRRWEMETLQSSTIHLLAWYAVAAGWRWYCKSKNFCSDPYAVNMQLSHFCATLPDRTLNVIPWLVVIVEGGWPWLIKITVVSAFNTRPTLTTRPPNYPTIFLLP